VFLGFNFTLFEKEIAAHAQMDQQTVIRKTQDEILGSTRDFFNFLPSDQRLEFARGWQSKRAGPAQIGILNDFAK
jgi:hypothetical protein